MNSRVGSHQLVFRHWLASRRLVLCASIAISLAGWHGTLDATPIAAAAAAGASATDAAANSNGSDAQFDRSLLPDSGQNTTDLSRFEHGNVVTAGIYNVDVFLNNTWMARSNVRLAVATPNANATPCVTRVLLDQLGLHPAKLSPDQIAQLSDPKACVSIGSLIPSATMSFNQSNLRLDTSVPQAFLQQMPRGYVSSEYWDPGVTAALANYNINSFHTSSQGVSQTSSYLGLNDGINFAGWEFRNSLSFTAQTGSSDTPAQHRWQNIQTYLQRSLPSLHAQLTVGDSYTDGSVFDSIGIRGVQLATDDRMLPDSLRGYAPTVRGVAETNAKVTVRQNGIVLYETTVAPGPFEINDLYSTGYGGDLNVTVTEADGRVRGFSVPYASVPQLLRPGVTRFSVVAGELHDTSIHAQPAIAQATIQHGFTNLLSGYAGIVGSNGYGALLVGSALNTRYGALALDITTAQADIPGQSSRNGQSVRLSYSKILPDSNTSLTVATYRYSTSGYLGLRDALTLRDIAHGYTYIDPTTVSTIDGIAVPNVLTPDQRKALQDNGINNFSVYTSQLDRQRSRFDINLTQRLGQRGGSVYVTGSAVDYWNRNGTDLQFQVGYNNTFHRVSYSVSATRVRDALSHYSNELFASFTLPLGNSAHAPLFGLNANRDSSGHMLEQGTLSGTAGVDNQFSYGATASHDNGQGGGGSAGNTGTVYAGYRSPFAQLNASYGSGSGYSQASLSVTGAIVAHPGGVIFGQATGDTMAIISAPGAAGARVVNASGVRINSSGYALVPYLTPYNLNNIQIDPKGLPLTVQMDATSAQVAPHVGAVVMLSFKTQTGHSLVARIRQSDGTPVPFGAEVVDEQNQVVGVVGQAGRTLLRSQKDQGQLSVQWKNQDSQSMSCSFPYHLSGDGKTEYEQVQATCKAVAASRSDS